MAATWDSCLDGVARKPLNLASTDFRNLGRHFESLEIYIREGTSQIEQTLFVCIKLKTIC